MSTITAAPMATPLPLDYSLSPNRHSGSEAAAAMYEPHHDLASASITAQQSDSVPTAEASISHYHSNQNSEVVAQAIFESAPPLAEGSVAHHSNTTQGSIEISRTSKEVGRHSVWHISHNGRPVFNLSDGTACEIPRVRAGDFLDITVRDYSYRVTINEIPPNTNIDGNNLKICLKQKVSIKVKVTGFEEVVFVEPSRRGNTDLESSFVSFHRLY